MANKNAGKHFSNWKQYNKDNNLNLTYKEWKDKVGFLPKTRKKENSPLQNQATVLEDSSSSLDDNQGAV